jgi:molybdate transport system ATP-binding protein
LDVRFTSAGRPLGILGASGSGKSMTLKCVAGIETPDEGHIEMNGRVLFDSRSKINLRPQQRNIGYLFQSYALFPHMTVEGNIACALPGKKTEKAPHIARLLARYQLQRLEKQYPAQLSGGQQQRVALARIFAYQPKVLLLDEPFSALDTFLKEALQVEMIGILQQYEGDAVLVTHNRDEAYKICDEMLVIDNGRAVTQGDTKAMFRRPAHLAQARLTGCKNFSRAQALSPGRVRALDWGVELDVTGPLPEGFSHVGVRAHDFSPAETGAQNAIPVRVTRRVEGPFEWNVLFQNARQGGGAEIWWKYPKGAAVDENPKALSAAPENVLLLTDGNE